MPLEYGIAIGMSPAAIFLELEKDNLGKRELLLAHAVLKQFDMFDMPVNLSGDTQVAGFQIADRGPGIAFESHYSIRSKGIVEEGINEAYPEHKGLFTNASVDHEGYVTVRGIHANDVLKHPYIRACFELTKGEEEKGDLAVVRMRARFAALDMMELPRPTQEALDLMLATMGHNGPSFRYDVQDRLKYLANTVDRNNPVMAQYTQDLASFAPLVMYSGGEARDLSDRERAMMSQWRVRFLARHQGTEAVFTPIPPEDQTLNEIRRIVQTSMMLNEVDMMIEQQIGQEVWAEFTANPKAFCDARADKEDLEEDAPSDPDFL